MNDSTKILAEFANGLIDYDEYLELVDSGHLSPEVVELIPFGIFEPFMSIDKPNLSDQLDLMDKLREWGETCDLTANQFVKAKTEAFDFLRSNIIAAFRGVSLENGVTLAQANAIDGYKSEEEQAHARLTDKNIAWQDYPVQDLENFTSLLHLDAKGFAYYIPAYMLWCIDKFFSDPYSNIASQTFGAFDPDLSKFKMRIQALTGSQRKSIREFLWLFAVHSNIYRETCVSGLQELAK